MGVIVGSERHAPLVKNREKCIVGGCTPCDLKAVINIIHLIIQIKQGKERQGSSLFVVKNIPRSKSCWKEERTDTF